MPASFTSGSRPEGYAEGDSITVRIPHDSVSADHADVRRKLATGWKLGEVCGDDESLFKYAYLYPPMPRR